MKWNSKLHVFCIEQLLADKRSIFARECENILMQFKYSKKPAIISSNFLENFYKNWNHLIPRIPQVASCMQSKTYSSCEGIVPFFKTRSSTRTHRYEKYENSTTITTTIHKIHKR